ncbi:hypothetical protein [Streptomyces sp. NPDC021622]|uniref:hypothetical protein n=1 Tax=Streptomyces sp. NPDC021622 TaxID=3155013 RepID=UPI0033C08545
MKRHDGRAADVPVGLLDELVELVDTVADRIGEDDWSLCACGEAHGRQMWTPALCRSCAGTRRSPVGFAAE